MLVAELVRPGVVELQEAPVPTPGPGELVVRVETALTCGTDVKTYQRGHPKIPLPTRMGHEFAGIVASVGVGATAVRAGDPVDTKGAAGGGAGGRTFREGDAIVCVPSAPCGACRLCRRGHESLCPHAVGRMVFGAFAEYVLLPAHIVECNVFHRPATMAAEVAAALEPLACVVHGADRVALGRAERVVLLGDGPIALLFVQLARLAGAGRVLLVGKHRVRLDAARSLGAEVAVHPASREGMLVPAAARSAVTPRLRSKGDRPEVRGAQEGDRAAGAAVPDGGAFARPERAPSSGLRDVVFEWSDGIGADVVIECVGRPEAWEEAASLAAPGGEVLLYGGCAAGTGATFETYQIHYQEVDLKGAFHYGRPDVRKAYELLVSGTVRVEPLITHRRPLTRLTEALELVLSREAIKVAVEP